MAQSTNTSAQSPVSTDRRISLDGLKQADPDIFDAIQREGVRQEEGLELIASENYVSQAVLDAMGSVLTNKYSEGYIGRRYYAGNEIIDEVESMAIDRAKKLFSAEHVNVQPLSGSPANLAVYLGLLQPGDKVLGLKLDHGGHLSHGHPVNFSGNLYEFVQYEVDEKSHLLDMDKIREIAKREKPKMIVAGFSAYSRNIDWKAFQSIADEVGAISFGDIAHISGLIAGKALENPVPIFDVVTTTTHKTLRGPRGAIIMCKEQYKKEINRAVFPGVQGGPHDHINAAKAVCFREALDPSFARYAAQVIENARALSKSLQDKGWEVLTGGTDNHLLVLDFRKLELTGKVAEKALDIAGISCSRSTVPFDPRKAMNPSGVRLGSAAITTRGMGTSDMVTVAECIHDALKSPENEDALRKIHGRVSEICKQFPLYGYTHLPGAGGE